MGNTIRKKTVPQEKRYSFPKTIKIIRYGGYILVVSIETANWIVLENEYQLRFFELLKGKNIGQSLEAFDGDYTDAQTVVTQLEARNFEYKNTIRKSEGSSLHIYLTNACNLRCPHCYMFSGQADEQELTDDEIEKLIVTSHQNGVTHIVFSGGEAIMHPGLIKFVDTAHNLEMDVEILSNGTLITENIVKKLAGKLSRVQISIDGYSEESNAKVRGKGSFSKALRAVELLTKYNIPTDVGITPRYHDKLHLEIPSYVTFVKELQKRYRDKIVLAFTSELFDGRYLSLTPEQRNYYRICIDKISESSFGTGIKESGFIEFHKQHGIDDNCAYGNITVASNGDVFFCPQITPMNPCGNIRINSYEKIFKLSNEAKKRSDVNNLTPCSTCELKYICGGDCRINYFESLLDCANTHDIPNRVCSQEQKNSFYELMINTNTELFQ